MSDKGKDPFTQPLFAGLRVYRGRGEYLSRLEQYDKTVQAYDEALRFDERDVKSLVGRSDTRAYSARFEGALRDAELALDADPENLQAAVARARALFLLDEPEAALVLYSRCARRRPALAWRALWVREALQQRLRVLCAERARLVEERGDCGEERARDAAPQRAPRRRAAAPPRAHSPQCAAPQLGRLGRELPFLRQLAAVPSVAPLAARARADLERYNELLRVRGQDPVQSQRRRRALSAEARVRAGRDVRRALDAVYQHADPRNAHKCIELADRAKELIRKRSRAVLPRKAEFLEELYTIVGKVFLAQKCLDEGMNETDKERRVNFFLGMSAARAPTRDSVVRSRPLTYKDPKKQEKGLEAELASATSPLQFSFIYHELGRLCGLQKKHNLSKYYAAKCLACSRAGELNVWAVNACFLLVRCHFQQCNKNINISYKYFNDNRNDDGIAYICSSLVRLLVDDFKHIKDANIDSRREIGDSLDYAARLAFLAF